MNRRIIAIVLSTLLSFAMSAGIASADHHEKEKPPTAEHEDHGKQKGHEKAPEHGVGGDMSGHEDHGDHHKDHGKKPKTEGDKSKK
jgi:hypothetical protein